MLGVEVKLSVLHSKRSFHSTRKRAFEIKFLK